jgi:hypothetical protein
MGRNLDPEPEETSAGERTGQIGRRRRRIAGVIHAEPSASLIAFSAQLI